MSFSVGVLMKTEAVSNFSRAIRQAEQPKSTLWRDLVVLILIIGLLCFFMSVGTAYEGSGSYMKEWHGPLHILPYLKALLFN